MAGTPRTRRLVRVSQGKMAHLKNWREGVNLAAESGQSIDQLKQLAAAGRWRFAYALRREGNRALRLQPPMFRVAVARFYYAMYHSMRAVVYMAYDGDDHEDHRTLPTKDVEGLPGAVAWQNMLKDARSRRNDADYDPFPLSDRAWATIAAQLKENADEILQLSRGYLVQKGCVLP